MSLSDNSVRAAGLCLIAEAQASGGLIKESVITFGQAIQFAKSIKDDGDRASAIVSALTSAGKLTEGFQLARTIMQEPSRSDAFREIVKAQIKVGNIAEALPVANSITDLSKRAVAFREIVEAQVKAGNIVEALSVAHSITDGSERASAFNAIVEAEAKAGKFSDALKHAEFANNLGRYAILEAQTKAGRVSEAVQLAESVKDGLSWDRSRSFSTITIALARAGKIGEAFRVAQSISVDDIRAPAVGEIASAQALAGQPKDAANTFRRAIEIARSIPTRFNYSRAVALMRIGEAQAKAGMAEASAGTFDQAVQAAQSIKGSPYPERYGALNDIVIGLVKADNITKALIIIGQTIEEDSFRQTMFSQIVRTMVETKAKESDLAEAIKVAQSIKSELDRITAFGEIARAQARARLKQSAIRTLEQQLQAARAIANDNERILALITIAEAWPN